MIKKSLARDLMKNKRDALDESFIKSASIDISKRAYGFITANYFKKTAIYMSIKNEVRIEYVIYFNKEKNIEIFLPVCKKEDYICFSKFNDMNSMHKDYYGIACPAGENAANEKDIEVFFIPGLAFDSFGNRVGYGKGCFDRILKKTDKSVLVGVCYDFQFISDDILESENNDIAMDFIITEKGMLRCPHNNKKYHDSGDLRK